MIEINEAGPHIAMLVTPTESDAPMRESTRHRTMFAAMPWLLALVVAGFCPGLAAQEMGDAAAGRHLAETWCSTCHLVGPAPQRAVSTGAPSLAAVAGMTSTTPMSLRAFLQTPHDRMPDLHLSNVEIDDVAVYILGLRGK